MSLWDALGIFAGVGLLAVIGVAWYAARRSGRETEQLDQAERSIDAGRTRVQVDEDLRRRSDGELRDRLRSKRS